MSNLLNRFFRSSMIISFLLFILGCLLIYQSEVTVITISYIIGSILIALGVVGLIRYVKNIKLSKSSELDIVYGIISMIFGALMISHPKALASVIPIVLGICIVVSSSTKLQYAFELKKDNNSLWLMTLIVAVVSATCGVVLIFNPFKGANMLAQIIGVFIIVYSVLDIFSTITIKRNVTSIKKAINDNIKVQEAEILEERQITSKEKEDNK